MGRHEAGLAGAQAIAEGLVGGTWVKTPSGLLPAEELACGDVVTTHDGRARIAHVSVTQFASGVWDAYPRGLLLASGEAAFYILPDQPVLFADRAVLASDLVGIAGLMRVMPVDPVTVVVIALDRPAAVIADDLCLPCPAFDGRRMAPPLGRMAGRRLARRVLGRPVPARLIRT